MQIHTFVRKHNVALLIAITASVVIIIADTLLSRTLAFIPFRNISTPSVILVFVAVFIVTQYILLKYVKNVHRGIPSNIRSLKKTQPVVTVVQFSIGAILIVIAIEIVLQSQYDLIFMKAVLWLSYGLSISLLALLAIRFVKWLKSSYNIVVATYAMAIMALLINVMIGMIYASSDLETFPDRIRPVISAVMIYDNPERPLASLSLITSAVSFSLTWLATTLLLRHHSKKLGKIKYWIVITLPLVYFLGQFQSLFVDIFSDYRLYDSVLFGLVYTVVFSLAKPLGGFLFGLAFWIIARKVQNVTVRDCLFISGAGFLLLFASDQARALVISPYPPFGVTSISYVGIASYFILIGIYLSAVSVAHDNRLRRAIRRTVELEYEMLEKIASSELNEEIQNRALKIWERTGADELPLESSLADPELNRYIDQVFQEVGKGRKL